MKKHKEMRTIKFRGKDLNGEWVYGDLHTLCDRPHIHTAPSSFPYAGKRSFVDEKTIGQYTGVNDKQGREIYEGDIVLFFKRKLKITWKEEDCSFIMEDDEILLTLFKHNASKCEIIGNIYENDRT